MGDQPLDGPDLYLRPDVQVEPLIDNWYAWSYLIPPHTAARNITERHLKIMDSYISSPQIHANAAKNPKLLGGPFVDYGGKRVDEIRALREETKSKRAAMIELSAAISDLDLRLRAQEGFSLHPLYKDIPDALRGYVELVYDLHNHASIRFIEPLLYRSRYYDRSAQSLMLSLTKGDDRPFVLSTPRMRSEDSIQLPLSFDSGAVDALFSLAVEPKPWRQIKDFLQVPDCKDALFRSFLTEKLRPPYQPYCGRGARWRYFGHACILIETAGLSFLFDPVLSYTYEAGISRYTYDDLPDSIDYVLITHNHQDHILFETLLQLRRRIKNIVVPRGGSGSLQDPSVKLLLEAIGFRNVLELSELQTIDFHGGSFTGLPFLGEHSDLDVHSKMAYLMRVGRHTLLLAADSCNIHTPLYEHLKKDVGDVEVLFIGMECDGAPLTWLYGPLLSQRIERAMDESRRLSGSNYQQAIEIVNCFCCKEVYVYAMGQEPWLNHVMSKKYTEDSKPIQESNRLIGECTRRNICAERLFGEKEILIDP